MISVQQKHHDMPAPHHFPCQTLKQSLGRSGMIKWPGGKAWLAPEIISRVGQHTCYVEVFGGAAAVLFRKPRSPVEIYNDINGDLVTLFRVVKYHVPELQRELSMVLRSRQEYRDYLTQPGVTDIQRAARFYLCSRWAFGGKASAGRFATSRSSGLSHRNGIARLEALAERLDAVAVEHLDWRGCLARFDGPETVFFLDPPYAADRSDYGVGFTSSDIGDLTAALKELKGRWILTMGERPDVHEAFAGCRFERFERLSRRNNRPGMSPKPIVEYIITAKADAE